MNYHLIILVASYLVAIQLTNKLGLKPATGAIIAVVIPFTVSAITAWILIGSNPGDIWGGAITLSSLVILTIQFALMYLLLRYFENNDSIASYLFMTVVGLLGIVFVVPFVAGKLIG